MGIQFSEYYFDWNLTDFTQNRELQTEENAGVHATTISV
jgi:hypothetical protein